MGQEKPLIELMDEVLISLNTPYKRVSEFLTSDKESAKFISSILNDADYPLPDNKAAQYALAETRARHCAITYLLGLVFSPFASLYDSIPSIFRISNIEKKTVDYIWLSTALYHDYGYFSNKISNGSLDYKKEYKYYLLCDHYDAQSLKCLENHSVRFPSSYAFTYREILSYDSYARDYHAARDDAEKIDHGILGGFEVFDRLVKKTLKRDQSWPEKRDVDLLIAKTSCLTVSQHNIYKSDSVERDKKYPADLKKLYYNSSFRISPETPLLLFLCLIDTIECVKRFSKENLSTPSLTAPLVLSRIYVSVSKEHIIIDFSSLLSHIQQRKSEKLEDVYNRYINALVNIHQWTAITATKEGKSLVHITLSDKAGNR